MPKVVREDIDNLNAVLTVTVDKASYEPKFIEELKNYKNKAQMKGFRKGKTPTSFIKKIYGKSILAEIVQNMLQEELGKFFQEDETNYLGQPIPNDNSEAVNFDPRDLSDYEFKFDVGFVPEFELIGMESIKSFEKYVVEIPDNMVDEEIDRIQKQKGERIDAEDTIIENDMISMTMKELDGDEIKEGGWESTFSILVSRIANEDLKKEILTKKKGDKVRVNPHDLEDADETHIRKYILNMTEDDTDVIVGDSFEAIINSVNRVVPSELNQEFFDGYLGAGKVSSEAEFREEVRKDVGAYHSGESDGLLFRAMRKDLIANNKEQLALPDEFLKKWLVASSEQNTPELVDRDYDRFSDNLRWSLISTKLTDQFEIKLEEADIRNHLAKKISSYMGGYFGGNEEMMNNMVDRLLQDREQLTKASEELVDERVFQSLKSNFAITDRSITLEDFKEVLEKVREEDAPPPGIQVEDEEE